MKTNPNSTYLYEFNFVGSRNFMRTLLNMGNQYKGACHGDDLGYLFEGVLVKFASNSDSADAETINRMVKLWTNFAKYGNPTPDGQQLGVTWTPVQRENLFYLHIDKELIMKSNPNPERMSLWREIYSANDETKNFIS